MMKMANNKNKMMCCSCCRESVCKNGIQLSYALCT